MLTVDQIREKLKDRKITVVCKKIGISRAALHSIMRGTSLPSYETLEKLSRYFKTSL